MDLHKVRRFAETPTWHYARHTRRAGHTELSSKDFARTIRALRLVYSGVRTMLAELADELKQPPNPLYDLGVRVRPITTRINPDERFLRTWEARLYSPTELADDDEEEDEENDDEDGDDERRDKRDVNLARGQNVAFVKVVLYDRNGDEGEPHLLCGALHDAHVAAGSDSLQTPRAMFQRILEQLDHDTKIGPLQTKRRSAGLRMFRRSRGPATNSNSPCISVPHRMVSLR